LQAGNGIDAAIDAAFQPLASALSRVVFYTIPVGGADVPWIVLWLIAGAVFFTFYLRFINLRGFGHALRLVRGDFTKDDAPGEVSHYQALATAVSGTVGVGNIAHVAVAVSVGGPGAIFWIVVAGFLGMSTKFVECALAVRYRERDEDGTVAGGPMYAGRAWAVRSLSTTPPASCSAASASAACSRRTRPTCRPLP